MLIGRELQRIAQHLDGPVTLDVYEGSAHDFFLRSVTRNASAARSWLRTYRDRCRMFREFCDKEMV